MGGGLRTTITVFGELLLSPSILDMKQDGMEVNGNIKMMVLQFPFPCSEAQACQVIFFSGENPNVTYSVGRVLRLHKYPQLL